MTALNTRWFIAQCQSDNGHTVSLEAVARRAFYSRKWTVNGTVRSANLMLALAAWAKSPSYPTVRFQEITMAGANIGREFSL